MSSSHDDEDIELKPISQNNNNNNNNNVSSHHHHHNRKSFSSGGSSSSKLFVTLSLLLIAVTVVFTTGGGLASNKKSKNSSGRTKDGEQQQQKETPQYYSSPPSPSSPTTTIDENPNPPSPPDSSSSSVVIKYIYYDDDDLIKFDESENNFVEKTTPNNNNDDPTTANEIVDQGEPIFDFDYSMFSNNNNNKNQNKVVGGKWIAVDRKRAMQWFQSYFGLTTQQQQQEQQQEGNSRKLPTYSCGIAAITPNNNKNGFKILDPFDYSKDDELVFADSQTKENDLHVSKMKLLAFEKEFNDQAALSLLKSKKMKQQFSAFLAWKPHPIPMIAWYDSSSTATTTTKDRNQQDEAADKNYFQSNSNIDQTMFLKTCSPRMTANGKGINKALYSISSTTSQRQQQQNSFRIRSFSEPSVGLGCMRKLLILDGHSSSFSQAMIKRCVPLTNLNKIPQERKNYIKRRKRISNNPDDDDTEQFSSSSSSSTPKQPFVVALGHSHTRYLAALLCMLANNSWCADFNSIKTGRVPFYPTEMFDSVFLRPDKVVVMTNPDENAQQDTTANTNNNNENVFGAPAAPAVSSTSSTLLTTPTFIQDLQLFSSSSSSSSIEKNFNLLKLQPLPMVYAASYYDQRISLIKLLTWMNAKSKVLSPAASSLSSSSSGLSERHKKLLQQKLERENSDFEGTNLGIRINNISNDEEENDEQKKKNDAFDQEIIDWVQQELFDSNKNKNNVPLSSSSSWKFPLPIPTHFILSRGEWDLLYLNPDPKSLTIQIQRSLHVLSKSFLSATLIFQLPQKHYGSAVHRRSKEKSANRKAIWRNNCGSETRVLMLRNACICGAYRFYKKSENNNNKNRKNSLILFDTNSMTKTEFGFTFVDALGHHYIDAALEVMAQEIRRIIEREHVAKNYISKTQEFLDSIGQESCDKIDEAAKKFREDVATSSVPAAEKKCSCHRNEPDDPNFCKMSKMLPRSVG